jgi:hypothetical protein
VISEFDVSSSKVSKREFDDEVSIWECGRSSAGSETNLQKSKIELDAFSETKSLSVSAIKTKAAIFNNK